MTSLQRSAQRTEPLTIEAMLVLIEDLHGLIEEENGKLAMGLPASLAQTVARKTRLADELEGWLALMRQGAFAGTDPQVLAHLVERLQSLGALMRTNTSSIKRSMEASRRRIDAIMRALRDEPRQMTGYGPNAARRPVAALPAGNRLA